MCCRKTLFETRRHGSFFWPRQTRNSFLVLCSAVLAGCSSGTFSDPFPPPVDPPVEPPPPAVSEVLLFSIVDGPDGEGQPFLAQYVGTREYRPSVDSPSLIDGGVVVFENGVELGSFTFDENFFLGSNANLNFFAQGPSGVGKNADVLSAGEGEAYYDFVSFAEIQDVYVSGCSEYGCAVIKDIGYEYFLFGYETENASPNYSATYTGEWRGELLLIGEAGVDFNQGYHVEGPAHIEVDFGPTTMSGTLFADSVFSNQRYSWCSNCINLADIDLEPSVIDGATTVGTASTTLSAVSPDDRLEGTYEASFFGPDAEEVGGMIYLNEDNSHLGGVDPDPSTEIVLYGVFVGQ